MPNQIGIISIQSSASQPNAQFLTYAFWFPVTSGFEIPLPSFTSAFVNIPAADLALLRSGALVEETGTIQLDLAASSPNIKAELLQRWTDRAAKRAQAPNPNLFGSSAYDGATWGAVAAVSVTANAWATSPAVPLGPEESDEARVRRKLEVFSETEFSQEFGDR